MDKHTGKKSRKNKSDTKDYTNNREEYAKDNEFGKEKGNKPCKENQE